VCFPFSFLRKNIFFLTLTFSFPLILFSAPSADLSQGLRALQQIRSLIPERFFEEEFQISVDEKAFKKPLNELSSHKFREKGTPFICMLGKSNRYLLRWTMSGEPVRISDSYLEFEYGPFWKYPTALERLEQMESAIYRIDQ
jgi:hypothetical protein